MFSELFLVSILFASAWGEATFHQNDIQFQRSFEDAMAKAGVTPFMLEAEIIAKIESFLSSLPTYIPYQDVNVSILNDNLSAQGYVENVTASGIENHIIDQVKFSILPLGFSLHINFENVTSKGKYDIQGLFANFIPLYGNKDFTVAAINPDLYVKVDMTSSAGHIVVTKIDFQFSLGAVELKFNNFLGGGLGVVIAEIIEENLSDYVDRFLYYYGDQIIEKVTVQLNEFFSDKSVQDLIDWITGKTTTPSPSTTPAPVTSKILYPYIH